MCNYGFMTQSRILEKYMINRRPKRIGLLTLPLHDNYGGLLQAIALYTYLSHMGHSVTLIRKVPYQAGWKRMVLGLLRRMPFQDVRAVRSTYLNSQKHEKFINSIIKNQSEHLATSEELQKLVKDVQFDYIVVGSDQVWRFEY